MHAMRSTGPAGRAAFFAEIHTMHLTSRPPRGLAHHCLVALGLAALLSSSFPLQAQVGPASAIRVASTEGTTVRVPVSRPATILADSLSVQAPELDRRVLTLATQALSCARKRPGELTRVPMTLAIIDYSLPSTERRLWVFDLASRELLFHELVAHGRNSGGNLPTQFSNAPESLMSSLGAFETAATYVGHNGYSLRLRGLEPGFNDKAMERAIVIHGASYVDTRTSASLGRIGRSWGCPAVRPAVARPLIDRLAEGAFVFAYYPQSNWLQQSQLLGDCESGLQAQADGPRT